MTSSWLSEFIEKPTIPTPYLPEIPWRAKETYRLIPNVIGDLEKNFEQNRSSEAYDTIILANHAHVLICRMTAQVVPDAEQQKAELRRCFRYIPVLSLLRDTYFEMSVMYMPTSHEEVSAISQKEAVEGLEAEIQIHEGLLTYLLIFEDDRERIEQGLLDFTI
jgi:hypothetical protein